MRASSRIFAAVRCRKRRRAALTILLPGSIQGKTDHARQCPAAIAPSRHRRRADRSRAQHLQGPRPGRHRRRVSQLRDRPCGLEGEGAGDRRQCADALFRRAPAPAARPRPEAKTRNPPVEKTASQYAAQQLVSACCGVPRGRMAATRLAHEPVQLRAGRLRCALRPCRGAMPRDLRVLARPAFPDAVHQDQGRAIAPRC